MPQHVKPMLAMAGDLPTKDAGWAYEFKWDGVRAMLYVDGGRVRAFTRNDKSLLSTFPELRDIGLHLGSRSAILDGEIVALDEDGRPNFSTLSKRLHVTSKPAIEKLRFSIPASFFAFDLLYLEGRSHDTASLRRASRGARIAQTLWRDVRDTALDHQHTWFEGDGHLSRARIRRCRHQTS